MSVEMNARTAPGPVGSLAALPGLERRLVEHLRLWRDGRGAVAGLDALMEPIATFGRHPLRIGAPGDPGVSGDECVLARFVGLAAEGAREDAILIATLLVRADMALGLGRIAEALGHRLMRAALRPEGR